MDRLNIARALRELRSYRNERITKIKIDDRMTTDIEEEWFAKLRLIMAAIQEVEIAFDAIDGKLPNARPPQSYLDALQRAGKSNGKAQE